MEGAFPGMVRMATRALFSVKATQKVHLPFSYLQGGRDGEQGPTVRPFPGLPTELVDLRQPGGRPARVGDLEGHLPRPDL